MKIRLHLAIAMTMLLVVAALAQVRWTQVQVESVNGRRAYRAIPNNGVRLVRRLSSSACVEGHTWGYDSRGIWVSRGCRALFSVRVSGRPGGRPPIPPPHRPPVRPPHRPPVRPPHRPPVKPPHGKPPHGKPPHGKPPVKPRHDDNNGH